MQYLTIDSEYVFKTLDRLKIDGQFTIVSFGIYWDYYIDRIEGLSKDADYYYYHDAKIINLNGGSSLLQQCFYVMRSDDLPYLVFQEPSEEWKSIYTPDCKKAEYQLWLSLQKVKEHPEMLNEKDRERMNENPDELSVFAGIMLAQMHWKMSCPTIKIGIKYKLIDNGNVDDVEKICSFDAYVEKANQPKVDKIKLSTLEWKIMQKLEKDNKLSASRLGNMLKVKSHVVSKCFVSLKNKSVLERHGTPKSGTWDVVKDWQSKCEKE